METANETQLRINANRYTLGRDITERLLKLMGKVKEKDKIILALNYGHSVTKTKMRGTR